MTGPYSDPNADFDDKRPGDPFDAGPDVTEGDDAKKLLKAKAAASVVQASNTPAQTQPTTASGPASMIRPTMSDDEVAQYKTAARTDQSSQASGSTDTTSGNAATVYSDGSMDPTSRTTNPALARTLTAASTQPNNPYLGPEGGVGSAATGGAGLTQDQGVAMAGLNRNLSGYDPTAATRDYQSDLASVINRDPRSVSGIAARNAEVDRIWDQNTGPQQGRAGQLNRQLADEKYLRTINGLQAIPQTEFAAENQAGNEYQRNLTSVIDAAGKNAAALAGARTKADATRDVADTKADATRDVATTNAGAKVTSAGIAGQAKTDAATIGANRLRVDGAADAAFSRAYQSALARGLPPDQARAEAAQAQSALLDQRTVRQQGAAGANSGTNIPQGAIDHLRKNPDLASMFDQKYGKGASSSYLSQ